MTALVIVLAPAMIVALLGALPGIDAATGAVIAVLFVGAMPGGRGADVADLHRRGVTDRDGASRRARAGGDAPACVVRTLRPAPAAQARRLPATASRETVRLERGERLVERFEAAAASSMAISPMAEAVGEFVRVVDVVAAAVVHLDIEVGVTDGPDVPSTVMMSGSMYQSSGSGTSEKKVIRLTTQPWRGRTQRWW